jgi:hypothetical protein
MHENKTLSYSQAHITFPSQATTGTPIPALAVRPTKCQNPDPCHVPIISTEVNHLPSRPTISHGNQNTNSLPSFIQFANTSKIDNSALCRRRSRKSTQGIESCHSGGPFDCVLSNHPNNNRPTLGYDSLFLHRRRKAPSGSKPLDPKPYQLPSQYLDKRCANTTTQAGQIP